MVTNRTEAPDAGGDELADFLGLLNELKATGCRLLVVGDPRPDLFARASASLLGGADDLRYRLLAVTDATPRSVSERLPDSGESPRPLAETTRFVNHADAPRSATAGLDSSAGTGLGTIPQVRVDEPGVDGLETALVEGVEEFADRAGGLRPAQLRVGVDSLGPLLDHQGMDAVRGCLRTVGDRVLDNDGMAHYVLRESYDSERVRALADDVDAVIELRSVEPVSHGTDGQQRWHVPDRDLTVDWVRL